MSWRCYCVALFGWMLLVGTTTHAADAETHHNEFLTQELLALNSRLRNATDDTERQNLLDEMIAVARQRSEGLSRAVQQDPGQVLRVRLPENFRAEMPAILQPFLEKDVVLHGTLEFLVEDSAPPQSTDRQTCKLRCFLRSEDEQIELFFAGQLPELSTGTTVRVHGVGVNGALAAEDAAESVVHMPLADDEELAAASTGPAGVVTPVPYPDDVLGEQRVVVLMANFRDDPDEKPWTVNDVSDLVFATVSDYFYEVSYGQAWLTGDVFGWFTLSIDKSSCHKDTIEAEVDAAATLSGVDLTAYDRIIYLFPQATGCRYSGLASMGALPSRAWINGDLSLKTVGHELGHNFLLHHARGLDCQGKVLGEKGDGCTWQEYGDGLSIMGNGTGHFNAYQKQRLGWLGAGDSPAVTAVETSGTYFIEPYETATPGAKALNVLRSRDPETGAKTWYYIEYRQPLGFDAFLFNPGWFPSYRDNLTNGVAFHINTENPPGSMLLDMSPDSLADDLRDPALTVGKTYIDTEAGVAITMESADPGGAVVSVRFDGPTCSREPPELTVSPGTSEWVPPGTSVLYEVIVKNRDGSLCDDAVFLVDVEVPEGWTAHVAAPELLLSPGASGTTSVEVISSEAASDGFFDLAFTVENQASPNLSAAAAATYVVTTEVADKPGKGSKGKGSSKDDSGGGGNGKGRSK